MILRTWSLIDGRRVIVRSENVPSPAIRRGYVPAGRLASSASTGTVAPHVCIACGDVLPDREPGPGKPRRHCSSYCRTKAYRRRKAMAA